MEYNTHSRSKLGDGAPLAPPPLDPLLTENQSPTSLTAGQGSRARLKAPYKLSVFKCSLEPYLKHSDTKWNTTHIVDQNWGGGGGGASCAAPSGSTTDWEPEGCYLNFIENQKGAYAIRNIMQLMPFWFSMYTDGGRLALTVLWHW